MIVRAAVLELFMAFAAGPGFCADPALDVITQEFAARTLPKETPIEIEVRLKAGEAELSGISLATFSNDGITAALAPDTPAQFAKLAPKSEHSWRLRLTRSIGSVLTDSILHIRAEFDVAQQPEQATTAPAGAGGNAPSSDATPGSSTAPTLTPDPPPPKAIHQLIYATAKIKPPAVVTGVDLARAEIKGLPESLAHERPGRMFVVITNQYSTPLTVKNVKPLGPTYVDLLPPEAKDVSNRQAQTLPLRIGPGQSEAIVYEIRPKSQVVPGKYTFVAEVDVETDDKLTAAVLTPAQEINVVVLGESDLFKFLGIPSLLFLPGVLMLITWQFLALWGKSEDEAKHYKPQWNTSDFWVIAVALSLLTALVYPWLTDFLLHTSRNFVSAYGLTDYGLIFGFSLLASILGFAAKRAITAAVNQLKASNLAKTTPTVNDSPLQILEKLARLKTDNLFQQYAAGGNQATHLLRLEPWSTEAEVWLVPRAEISVRDETSADAIDERDRLVNQPPGDVATVLAKIKEGMRSNWWNEPVWRHAGDVRRPLKVPSAGWNRSGDVVPLLQGD